MPGNTVATVAVARMAVLGRNRPALGSHAAYEFIEKAFALPEVKAELMRSVNAHNRREGTS